MVMMFTGEVVAGAQCGIAAKLEADWFKLDGQTAQGF